MKLFIYIVILPWLTLPQVFVHIQEQIAKENSIFLAKRFTRTNRILHRHACDACDKFHAWLILRIALAAEAIL